MYHILIPFTHATDLVHGPVGNSHFRLTQYVICTST